MVAIIPAVLTDTVTTFHQEVRRLASISPVLHLDFADGRFVPAHLLDPSTVVSAIANLAGEEVTLRLACHLMVLDPEHWVEQLLACAEVEMIIVHAEAGADVIRLSEQCRGRGVRFGLALNPETSLSAVWPFLDHLDLVQFMTVHPGAMGGTFVPEVGAKIAEFRAQAPATPIAVDGGISPQTLPAMLAAGASHVVVGSFFHDRVDLAAAYQELAQVVQP